MHWRSMLVQTVELCFAGSRINYSAVVLEVLSPYGLIGEIHLEMVSLWIVDPCCRVQARRADAEQEFRLFANLECGRA